MQERQVTLSKETFMLPEPFLVMATQNPIEQEGTYPLPEAQVDRFMLKLLSTIRNWKKKMKIIRQKYHRRENRSSPHSESNRYYGSP